MRKSTEMVVWMGEQRILFVSEGLEDEPAFLHKLMKEAYPALHYRIYSYKTTIHTLAARLEEEYPDFDSGDVDIQFVLREMENDVNQRTLLSSHFSDVILAFDFDPHHDHPRFDFVQRMLAFYTDSTDMGKLYINYPMMQSFKHFISFPDPGYRYRCASPYGYKELVGRESRFSDLTKYSYETFVRIAVQNVKKLHLILHGSYALPPKEAYLEIDWMSVYGIELEMFDEQGITHVLNTLCFFLLDYNTSNFFSMVARHREKYDC